MPKQIRHIKNQINQARGLRLSWTAKISIAVFSAVLTFVFANYGKAGLVLPIINMFGVLSLSIFINRHLIKKLWFWAVITIFFILNTFLIFGINWTNDWKPALLFTVFDVGELFLMVFIIGIIDQYVEKPPNP